MKKHRRVNWQLTYWVNIFPIYDCHQYLKPAKQEKKKKEEISIYKGGKKSKEFTEEELRNLHG